VFTTQQRNALRPAAGMLSRSFRWVQTSPSNNFSLRNPLLSARLVFLRSLVSPRELRTMSHTSLKRSIRRQRQRLELELLESRNLLSAGFQPTYVLIPHGGPTPF